MNRIKYCITTCLIFFNLALAYGQEDVLRPEGKKIGSGSYEKSYMEKHNIRLGIEGGLNFNFFNSDMNWSNQAITNSPYRVFESGSGISAYFGFYGDLELTEKFGIVLRLNYSGLTFSNKYSGEGENIDNPNDICGVDFQYDYSASYFGTSLLFRADLTPSLILTVGPVIQVGTSDSSSFAVEGDITEGDCVFLSTGTQHMEVDFKSETFSRYGLEAGIAYDIPIAPKISLLPHIRFQYMINEAGPDETDPDDTRPWSDPTLFFSWENKLVHSLQAGVTLLFTL